MLRENVLNIEETFMNNLFNTTDYQKQIQNAEVMLYRIIAKNGLTVDRSDGSNHNDNYGKLYRGFENTLSEKNIPDDLKNIAGVDQERLLSEYIKACAASSDLIGNILHDILNAKQDMTDENKKFFSPVIRYNLYKYFQKYQKSIIQDIATLALALNTRVSAGNNSNTINICNTIANNIIENSQLASKRPWKWLKAQDVVNGEVTHQQLQAVAG